MPERKAGESRLVFTIDADTHEAFRVACIDDKISQSSFVRHIIKRYCEKDKNILKVVQDMRKIAKMDKKKRVKNIEKEDYKDFYDFDEDELDDIFDKIQEANPDL